MVERIVVNPQEVRGLGNVVNDEKTKQDVDVFNSYVTTESDLIDGIRIGIMRMTYNDPNLLFSFNRLEKFLYVNSDEASLGWYNKKLTLDSDDLIIGFDADNKTLYVGTDAPPVVHDYSISFSQDSYTAVDGSAEVSCTLLDNGVAVSGATVTFTGGTSTVTGTTGSNGVATVTVTFNATGTVTATYENVSDTATITVQTGPLFYDDCTTDKASQYGSSVSVDGKTTTESITFSTDHYVMSGSGAGFAGFIIPNVNQDNVKMRIKFKLTQTSNAAYNQFGLCVGNVGAVTTSNGLRIRNDKKFQQFNFTNGTESEGDVYTHGTNYSSDYFYVELIKQGTNLTIKLYDKDLNQLATNTRTITNYNNPQYMFYNLSVKGTSYATHIQEILVEAL